MFQRSRISSGMSVLHGLEVSLPVRVVRLLVIREELEVLIEVIWSCYERHISVDVNMTRIIINLVYEREAVSRPRTVTDLSISYPILPLLYLGLCTLNGLLKSFVVVIWIISKRSYVDSIKFRIGRFAGT